ncbi:methyltransferase [Dehalogenimonas sp. 4OHTPN]|uniref:Methyltransferase n=1 Tax=Dehalogenimonas sp. 4OHTPN TaxID=3166643 RepID=A0AAU8G8F0_9CHLR
MNYILLGAAGFLLMHLMDFASMRRLPLLKPFLSVSGTTMIIVAATAAALDEVKFNLPLWLSVAGWSLAAAASAGMVNALYVALPAGKTYIAPGTSGQLVTGGVYRLVRHPWLLFFALTMAGLALGSRSVSAAQAGAVWTLFSAALVWFQDRKIFPKMFPGYAAYQKSTPMLLPNRNSLSAFIEGLKQKKYSEV